MTKSHAEIYGAALAYYREHHGWLQDSKVFPSDRKGQCVDCGKPYAAGDLVTWAANPWKPGTNKPIHADCHLAQLIEKYGPLDIDP